LIARLANEGTRDGGTVDPVYLVKAHRSDRSPVIFDYDEKDVRIFSLEIDPFFFLELAEWKIADYVLPHVRIVDPPEKMGNIPSHGRAQRNAFAP
jgi:hypothetical protein